MAPGRSEGLRRMHEPASKMLALPKSNRIKPLLSLQSSCFVTGLSWKLQLPARGIERGRPRKPARPFSCLHFLARSLPPLVPGAAASVPYAAASDLRHERRGRGKSNWIKPIPGLFQVLGSWFFVGEIWNAGWHPDALRVCARCTNQRARCSRSPNQTGSNRFPISDRIFQISDLERGIVANQTGSNPLPGSRGRWNLVA